MPSPQMPRLLKTRQTSWLVLHLPKLLPKSGFGHPLNQKLWHLWLACRKKAAALGAQTASPFSLLELRAYNQKRLS